MNQVFGEGERALACDGRYWVRLTSAEGYVQEARRVGFAIGAARTGFVERYLRGGSLPPLGIWSLRDRDGQNTHLTAELDLLKTLVGPCFQLVWVKAPGGSAPAAWLLPDVFLLRDFCGRCDRVFAEVAKAIDEKGIVS